MTSRAALGERALFSQEGTTLGFGHGWTVLEPHDVGAILYFSKNWALGVAKSRASCSTLEVGTSRSRLEDGILITLWSNTIYLRYM